MDEQDPLHIALSYFEPADDISRYASESTNQLNVLLLIGLYVR
jgi:hypothetical protein